MTIHSSISRQDNTKLDLLAQEQGVTKYAFIQAIVLREIAAAWPLYEERHKEVTPL